MELVTYYFYFVCRS